MSAIRINPAVASDKQRIIDILVLAFAADPFERWMYSDPHEYLKGYPLFMDALITRSFETNNAYYAEGYAGAALWLAPNVHLDDEKIIAVLEQTIDKEKRADTMAVMEQMDRYHPHEPHWYLSIIGVDPGQRGLGLGSSLLQHTLAACDRERALAYLESTNPRNISLYQRHGFEVLGTIQAGEAPPMFPMLRKPR